MEQFKKCQVILLETEDKVNIILDNDKLELIKNKQIANTINSSVKGYNLYITSNEKINEGDWKYDTYHKEIIQVKSINSISKYDKKIIATTDTSLSPYIKDIFDTNEIGSQKYYHLPQPSQQFVEKYIESYNNDNVITDVLVEYIHYDEFGNYISGDIVRDKDELKLKISSKDNTITIKSIKDSWNREEVIELCKSAFDTGIIYQRTKTNVFNSPSINIDKWIEKNL